MLFEGPMPHHMFFHFLGIYTGSTFNTVPDVRISVNILAMLSNIGDFCIRYIHTYIPINGADLTPKKVYLRGSVSPCSL